MRRVIPVFMAAGLALAVGGCASSPAPAPASASAPAQGHGNKANFTAIANKLHSPGLLARVQLKQAKAKKDASLALRAAVNALKAGDDGLADQAADLIEKLQPANAAAPFIRLRTSLDNCDTKRASKAASALYAAGGVRPFVRIPEGPYEHWCTYTVINNLAAAHPEDAELSQLLAHTALQAGDNGAALAAAHKAEESGLDDLLTRIVAMQARWKLGQRKQALDEGAKILASHTRDAAVRSLYAGLLIQAGDYHRARETLGDGVALSPGNPHLELAYVLLEQAQGNTKAARKRLTGMLEKGDSSSGLYYLLGQEAESEGNWSQAFVYYTSARGDASAQVAAANALRHWKGLDTARDFLHKLEHRAPGLSPLWRGTEAGLLDAAGKTRQAYALLKTTVKEYPVVRPLRYQLAMLADSVGKGREAVRILAGLVQKEPDNADYLNSYGYELLLHTREYGKAQGYIQRALAMDPDNPAILDSMGWALYKQGKPAKALHYLKRANQGAGGDPTVASHLIRVYLALGRKDDARALLKKALAHSPGDAELKRLSKRLSQ